MSAQEKINKARTLLQANKISEAEGQLRQAVALDKRSAAARVELARILGATGRNAESAKFVDEALALEPDNPDALNIKGFSIAREENYSAAIPYYRKAIERNPQLAVAYMNLGNALRETGELVESEKMIHKALELEPKNFQAHYELAQTFAYQMKIKEAILEVLETLKLNPKFVRGYLALAKLYQQGNQLDDAIKILQQCLKANPDAWDAIELLKDFYLIKGDFASARKVWESVVNKRGQATDYVQLGNISLAAGDFEQAEKSFKRALEIDAKAWQPHYALGELYDVANLEEQAGNEYQLAVQYNQGSFEPHNGLGLFLLKKGDLAEAVRQLSTACKLAPEGEPTPVYNLSLALAQAQQFTQAKQLLEVALNGAPQGGLFDEMRRLLSAVKRELGEK